MSKNIIKIDRPTLTPEETIQRMRTIKEAAANLIKATEILHKRKETHS